MTRKSEPDALPRKRTAPSAAPSLGGRYVAGERTEYPDDEHAPTQAEE